MEPNSKSFQFVRSRRKKREQLKQTYKQTIESPNACPNMVRMSYQVNRCSSKFCIGQVTGWHGIGGCGHIWVIQYKVGGVSQSIGQAITWAA